MMGFLQRTLCRLLPVIAFLMCGSLWAQLTLPAASPYTQDFNTTPGASGTTYPLGWIAYDGTTSDNSMLAGSTSTTTTGGNHNYGSKIGLLASGSYTAPLYINLNINNTTGKTGLKISYKVIKIREQGRTNSFNLEISTTSATAGFTPVTGGSYDSGSLAQGNIATYTDLDISALDDKATGVYIRWAYDEIGGSGSRDGIALDDVVLSWSTAPVVPDAPLATPATSISSTGFTANWNAVANATGYRLDVATDNAFANLLEDYDNIAVQGLSKVVDLGIQPNTTYYYRVRAEQGAETSANSNTIQTATLLPPLPAPLAIDETAVLSNGFTANWEAVAGATGYYLDVSTSPDFGTITPGSFITETFENMPAPNSTPSTTTWTGDGGITWTATQNRTDRVIGVTTDRLLCMFENVPADDAYLESGVITGGLTGITFDAWKVLNNGSYSTMTVYVLSGPGFATQTTIGSIDTPNTIAKNIFNSGPITGITGDYKIRIEVTANYESTPGNRARTGINDLKFGADQVITPSFVTGYEGLDVGNVTSYLVTGLDPNTTYYYRVRAYSATQTSVNSNTIPVQTVCEAVALPTVTITEFCGAATVAELTATGTGLKWYTADAPTVELASTDALASGNYLVTQTVNGCTSAATPFTVTINTIPDAPAVTPMAICGSGTVADLDATGDNLKWYADNTTTTELIDTEVLIAGSYYVSQTLNGCESPRAEVVVTINTVPDAPLVTPMAICGSGTVADLDATGDNLKWYADNTTTTELADTEVLIAGSYYVSQTVNGCESPRAEVVVTINTVPDAPLVTPMAICGSGTVAELNATGTDLKWYADNTTTIELTGTETLIAGSYFVSQTVNGCESLRAELIVTINTIPDVPAVSPMAICGSGTVAELDATGTDLKWYADNTTTTELTGTEALVAGSYFVSQTVNGCESPRAEVVVTINTIPDAPAVTPTAICGSGTVAELDATGTSLKWYADNTTTTELTGTEALVAGSYFVSQTVNGCESPRAELEVTINTLPDAPQTAPLDFCGNTPATQLTATGANLKWYADSTTTTELLPTTTLSTQSYYVSQTVNGCESLRAEVVVTVTAIPAAPSVANPAQTFCSGATVAELLPNTAEYKWYISSSDNTALDGGDVLTNGLSIYYVSQIVNGCESTGRTPVAVMVNVTAVPTAAPQTFCDGATAAELDATGTSLKWYADATTTTQLATATELASGSYYVTQTLNNCESARVEVQVTVNAPTVTGDTTQIYNEGDTLADLDITGTGIVWYADVQLTQVLPETTLLVHNTTYYAVSVIGTCESEALPVNVQDAAGTDGFNRADLKYYPNPVTDVLNISYSEDITSVTVYNLLGQPVLQAKPNANNAQADMSSLAAGQYIVKLVAGNKTQTVKVVKH